jgi:hypothetical protein
MSFGYANIITNGAKYWVFPCKSMWEGQCFVGFFFQWSMNWNNWAMDKTPNIYYQQKIIHVTLKKENFIFLKKHYTKWPWIS